MFPPSMLPLILDTHPLEQQLANSQTKGFAQFCKQQKFAQPKKFANLKTEPYPKFTNFPSLTACTTQPSNPISQFPSKYSILGQLGNWETKLFQAMNVNREIGKPNYNKT